MSKVSLTVLEQQAAATNGLIDLVESVCVDKYGDTKEEVKELVDNWGVFYSSLLDLTETLKDVLGEIEK